MILKFDLQFFGGSSTSSQQIQKRAPQPEELNTLVQTLYKKIYPGLENFNPNTFSQAQQISDKAVQQQGTLLNQLPNSLSQNNNILNEMLGVTRSGNIPSGLSNALNASVNKELQGSMGNMLNNLSGRGVLNSSIASQGISRLGQQAADAFNKNYLTAYNSVLSGYGQALQGGQNNLASQLSAINALGSIPSQAQESAYSGLMPGFNFYKTWQQLENSKPEMYDTVVTQESSMCITGDTLVTLKDGSKVPVEELDDDAEILVWDFDNGRPAYAPLMAFYKGNEDDGADVFRVMFEDGSNVGVVYEHLFFDMTLGKFVAVNAQSQDYIGHEFAKINDEGQVISVKVAGILKDGKVTKTYAPQPERYWNFAVNGFISGNDGQLGFVNRFKFLPDEMIYDPISYAKDLFMYGRTGYDRFMFLMSEEYFRRNRFDETQIAVRKGLIDFGEFYMYLRKFKHCFIDKGVK